VAGLEKSQSRGQCHEGYESNGVKCEVWGARGHFRGKGWGEGKGECEGQVVI